MLFYRKAMDRGFSAGRDGARYRYELDRIRLLLAAVVVALVFVGAFLCRREGWQEGSTVLLHLGEIAFGGLVGLLFGEREIQRQVQ